MDFHWMTRQRSSGSKSAHNSYEFQYSSFELFGKFILFSTFVKSEIIPTVMFHAITIFFFSFCMIQFLSWPSVINGSVFGVFFCFFLIGYMITINVQLFNLLIFTRNLRWCSVYDCLFAPRINISNHLQGIYLKFKVWKKLDFLFLEAAQCLQLFHLLTW